MSANCLFCKIVNQEIPVKLAYEDGRALAFADINPQAPVHLLVIPRSHITGADALEAQDEELVGHLFLVMNKLAKEHGIADSGYRIVTNTGDAAGQSVPHLHFHLLGGRDLTWPPG